MILNLVISDVRLLFDFGYNVALMMCFNHFVQVSNVEYFEPTNESDYFGHVKNFNFKIPMREHPLKRN